MKLETCTANILKRHSSVMLQSKTITLTVFRTAFRPRLSTCSQSPDSSAWRKGPTYNWHYKMLFRTLYTITVSNHIYYCVKVILKLSVPFLPFNSSLESYHSKDYYCFTIVLHKCIGFFTSNCLTFGFVMSCLTCHSDQSSSKTLVITSTVGLSIWMLADDLFFFALTPSLFVYRTTLK